MTIKNFIRRKDEWEKLERKTHRLEERVHSDRYLFQKNKVSDREELVRLYSNEIESLLEFISNGSMIRPLLKNTDSPLEGGWPVHYTSRDYEKDLSNALEKVNELEDWFSKLKKLGDTAELARKIKLLDSLTETSKRIRKRFYEAKEIEEKTPGTYNDFTEGELVGVKIIQRFYRLIQTYDNSEDNYQLEKLKQLGEK